MWMPRLILQTRGSTVLDSMTDATHTLAPNRTKVSVIQVVSISSLPSAIGTSTRLGFVISRDVSLDFVDNDE